MYDQRGGIRKWHFNVAVKPGEPDRSASPGKSAAGDEKKGTGDRRTVQLI